jgi:hypothetical protein
VRSSASGRSRSRLCVGRLERDKGYATAVQAIARLGETGARLVVVGGGPERPILEQAARKAGVSDRVDFLGAKPRNEVVDYLAGRRRLPLSDRARRGCNRSCRSRRWRPRCPSLRRTSEAAPS